MSIITAVSFFAVSVAAFATIGADHIAPWALLIIANIWSANIDD